MFENGATTLTRSVKAHTGPVYALHAVCRPTERGSAPASKVEGIWSGGKDGLVKFYDEQVRLAVACVTPGRADVIEKLGDWGNLEVASCWPMIRKISVKDVRLARGFSEGFGKSVESSRCSRRHVWDLSTRALSTLGDFFESCESIETLKGP